MEVSSNQAIGIIVGIAIVVIIVIIIIAGIAFASNESAKSAFNDSLEEKINNEIKLFFQEKNINYEFRDSELENILRNRLRSAIIDQRTSGYTYKKSYINRTTTKDKEIYSIINKYYNLDKKGKVYNVDLEEENIKEIEYKEIK